MKRAIGTMVLAAWVVAGLTACEPPPPPPVLEVNSTDPGDDVQPGDGVCETAAENGICTLPAALQEADALGRADIDVPWVGDGSYPSISATFSGHVVIRGTGAPAASVVEIDSAHLSVEPEATLSLTGLHLADASDIRVDGTLTTSGAALYLGQTGVIVARGGTAVITNSLLWRMSAETPLVTNWGQLITLHTTFVSHGGNGSVVHTVPGAATRFAASRFSTVGTSGACCGYPAGSLGYNAAPDPSCGLTSQGDQVSDPVGEDLFLPDHGSPVIDAIPVGTLGCGAPGQTDVIGNPRPFDGDGDGVEACDIGAWEWHPGNP